MARVIIDRQNDDFFHGISIEQNFSKINIMLQACNKQHQAILHYFKFRPVKPISKSYSASRNKQQQLKLSYPRLMAGIPEIFLLQIFHR